MAFRIPHSALRISIVAPAHNAAGTLLECLRALKAQTLNEPYEIILVDDGSTDGTVLIAQSFAPGVKTLRQAHRGAAAARNTGIAAAQGEIILFTDADCAPASEWAAVLADAIRGEVVGAKGTYRTRQQDTVARFVQAEYESKYRRMAGREYIDFIDTYSAAYRRDVLVEVGGFDERLPVDEDQELSFRLAARGYRLVFVPEAVVYHRHVTSLTAYARRKFRIGYWKVAVAARHPGRIVADSHTPQSIKLQMLLVGVCGLSLLAAPISRWARTAAIASSAGFLASTLPFAARLASKDPALALATPLMMVVRALALCAGVVAGLARMRSADCGLRTAECGLRTAAGPIRFHRIYL